MMTTGLVNIVSKGEGCWTIFGLADFERVLHKRPCGYPIAYPQAVLQDGGTSMAVLLLASRFFFEKVKNFQNRQAGFFRADVDLLGGFSLFLVYLTKVVYKVSSSC